MLSIRSALSVSLLVPSVASGSVALGPLRVLPSNPRYFTADGEHAVFLTGSHTWDNLVDMGRDDPPTPFDFNRYLDFLERHNHNFIRLWAWDSTTWDTQANGSLGKDFIHNCAPQPWLRTGTGNALDGKPKFDLTRPNPAYFERLRSRVEAASRRGIYVSVMFFEGWGLYHGNRRQDLQQDGWAWLTHPFNPANNINGFSVEMSDDRRSAHVHRLGLPAVNAFQTGYIHRVVDTLNDLDNVLYEIINEGGEPAWDWWIVDAVRERERATPKQHPIGITGHGSERIGSMLASPADWISPGGQDGYGNEPPAWDGKKVAVLDTDHIWGVGGNPGWVWRSLTRGYNVLFMDPYDSLVLGNPSDTWMEPIRKAMGVARRLGNEANLVAMRPRSEIATTGYCLADDSGDELIVFQSANEPFTARLVAGEFRVTWIHPVDGTRSATVLSADGDTALTPPFSDGAVAHIKRLR